MNICNTDLSYAKHGLNKLFSSSEMYISVFHSKSSNSKSGMTKSNSNFYFTYRQNLGIILQTKINNLK